MLYTSLKQIKEDFQLESNDIVILRDQLNQVRTELHPDKNNGDFKNNTEKERYYKVSEAVAYIDSLKESNQLIVVEKLANLLESFSDIIPNKRESSLQNNLESRINSAIEGYKSLFFPKISLTAITCVATFLFVFPTKINDNPVLSKLLSPQSTSFIITWLYLLILTGALWLMTYRNEERAKKGLSLLKIDAVQNQMFEEFMRKCEPQTFSKDELTQYIFRRSFHPRGGVLQFGKDIITMEIAQGISELIINRAERKGIIEKSNSNTLSDNFLIKVQ